MHRFLATTTTTILVAAVTPAMSQPFHDCTIEKDTCTVEEYILHLEHKFPDPKSLVGPSTVTVPPDSDDYIGSKMGIEEERIRKFAVGPYKCTVDIASCAAASVIDSVTSGAYTYKWCANIS